ncbi:putative regulatory protein%2C FmdB family [Bordetella ansorpii]|uniref:Putative regulatory protein, FmdB family n=1 Tax=Bordetella ansorpii TaxID=288768 RepID=A0A157P994_9BORD|nr:FmdB family zinc ribbon protein [Bordetella ansorpii]SAI29814.1 putative regulatory protein%2C FmdB family [Bordetella ansorpii]
MPTYDYCCNTCGEFSALRPLARRNDPAACPACGAPAARTLGAAPALGVIGGAMRRALSANERSAHEPRSTRGGHGMNCGCCSGAKQSGRTRTAADGSKAFAGSRPWMISH